MASRRNILSVHLISSQRHDRIHGLNPRRLRSQTGRRIPSRWRLPPFPHDPHMDGFCHFAAATANPDQPQLPKKVAEGTMAFMFETSFILWFLIWENSKLLWRMVFTRVITNIKEIECYKEFIKEVIGNVVMWMWLINTNIMYLLMYKCGSISISILLP